MKLPSLSHNREAVIGQLGQQANPERLHSVGIRPGVTIEVLSRTSAGGLLVKVDDTRVVLGLELAKTIDCAYK